MEHAEDLQAYPETTFRVVLEQYRTSVIRFLYRLVEDQALAEELAQEVFLRAYRSPATYGPTWLFRSAMQMARNRSGGVYGSVPFGVSSPRILAHRAMAALPASQRAAVLMHKYEGFDYSRIGQVLGCPDSAVRLLLAQAYRTLHIQMRQDTSISRPMPWQGVVRSLPTQV